VAVSEAGGGLDGGYPSAPDQDRAVREQPFGIHRQDIDVGDGERARLGDSWFSAAHSEKHDGSEREFGQPAQ
jgi:hypothetical protein